MKLSPLGKLIASTIVLLMVPALLLTAVWAAILVFPAAVAARVGQSLGQVAAGSTYYVVLLSCMALLHWLVA